MLAIIQPHTIQETIDHLLADSNREEFCIALEMNEQFVANLMYHGFLPMMMELDDGVPLLIPKLHFERCVLDFKDLHVSKRIRKSLDSYTLTCNNNYDNVIEQIIAYHKYPKREENWIHPSLQKTLSALHKASPNPNVQVWTFELWNKEGKLVAGEIGYRVGGVYTSLSGFHLENNTGKVQMILTAQWLEKQGFAFWDLGMEMPYKMHLGAHILETKEFMERLYKVR